MKNILPDFSQPFMTVEINGLYYRYTMVKEQEDDATVTLSHEDLANPGEKVFISMDLFFPQSYGSCSEGDINGEGYSEDLFLMISDDYGDSWIIIDSTMGGYNYWNTQIYEISNHLYGIDNFIAALYYTDCNGNWALGVGVDNFLIKVVDQGEAIFINPMSGWIDAGE